MRKVVATVFMTLDGVVQDPQKWSFPYWGDETQAFKIEELRKTDALLLGRTTYEGFAQAWPSRSGDEMSDTFNSMPKFVVSKTLAKADWNNSHILRGDLAQEVSALKAKPGKDLVVHGSVQLMRGLLEKGLLDQLNLLVYPIVLGEGKRLFGEGQQAKLKLIEAKPFKTGVVLMIYEKAAHTN
jgi:dihydrofolate reductase